MTEPTQKRILVVDDENPVREICFRVLKGLGYNVETAATGDEAKNRFETQPYDLVITDLRMPGQLDGLTLGHAIKKTSPHTPIILMTGFPDVGDAVETLRLGALDYLIKPFGPEELIRCVKACFAKQQPA
jgi:DNA-binding NtrC family response regulator